MRIAIARQPKEVGAGGFSVTGQTAHHIGHEDKGALQQAHDDRIFFEPARNLGGQILNAAVNFLCRNQNIQLCCHACAPFA